MLTLGLIRHGVTDWNLQKRTQGSSDIPLNAEGRAQAEALARRLQLQSKPWDALYSSDLSRARETAEIIAGPLGLSVQEDPRLQEKGHGQVEGTTMAERIQKWGEHWQELDLGRESNDSVLQRGLSFIDSLVAKYAHKPHRILVVSHGGLLAATLRELAPHIEKEGLPLNTSLTRLHYNATSWTCNTYNCTQHLITKEVLL